MWVLRFSSTDPPLVAGSNIKPRNNKEKKRTRKRKRQKAKKKKKSTERNENMESKTRNIKRPRIWSKTGAKPVQNVSKMILAVNLWRWFSDIYHKKWKNNVPNQRLEKKFIKKLSRSLQRHVHLFSAANTIICCAEYLAPLVQNIPVNLQVENQQLL